jgi:hypothetical protein
MEEYPYREAGSGGIIGADNSLLTTLLLGASAFWQSIRIAW